MLEDMKQVLGEFIGSRWTGKKAGLGIGMLVGIAILVFGFWNTFFVLLCGGIGLYVGQRIEQDEKWVEKMLASLQNRLPDRIQRWL